MKKFLSLLLAVMMLLGCLPAMAEESTEWKINQYTQLVARLSKAEKLEHVVVPAEVNGVAVRGVEYMAFNMYKNFKTLTIADSAVMLDRSVTRDLAKLEAIDLPENLLVIREGNFTNLPMLTSVIVPGSVAVVQSSFNSCKSLTSITFEGMCPVFVTAGTYGMFTDLPANCVIYVPDNQVDAYKAAFADREDVVARIQSSGQYASAIDRTAPESDFVFDASTGTITGYTGAASYLKIPAAIGGVQVKHIAADAFVKCHSICCVIIPEGVETVGDWAFAGISLLSYVSLPSTLVTMGSSAFSSAYMSAIAFGGEAVPAFDASAFGGFKGDWQLILPYGSSREYVDAFAAYLAPAAATGVVKVSTIEPYSFPALDAAAGAAFIGSWNSVAGKDVMGDFTNYYPVTSATLNTDGTGRINVDGDEMAIAWYVNSGYAIIAPMAADGSAYEDQAFAYANIDENGRLAIDYGYAAAICEQPGATYAAPAIPEKPWPEFNQSNATYFIGEWDAIEYLVEGATYPADLIGSMALILNGDGTALMVEDGEEPYALRWYADYAVAYVGETMSDLAEITFDGNGNIKLNMADVVVILAPHAEPVPEPVVDEEPDYEDEMLVAQPIGAEGEPYFGNWTMDLGGMMMTLTLNQDGTCAMEMMGESEPGVWSVVDGKANVMGDELYIDGSGNLVMPSQGMTFIRGSANAGNKELSEEEQLLALLALLATMEEAEGGETATALPEHLQAYVGTWHMVYLATGGLEGDLRSMGLTGKLELNADGTGILSGVADDSGNWYDDEGTVRFGQAETPLVLLDGGFLRYGNQLAGYMVFSQDESAVWSPAPAATAVPQIPAAPAAPQAPAVTGDVQHVGPKFVCKTYTTFGQTMDASMLGAEYAVKFGTDNMVEFTMAGFAVPFLPYTVNAEGVYVINYYGTMFNCVPTATGFDMDYYGTMTLHFTPAE